MSSFAATRPALRRHRVRLAAFLLAAALAPACSSAPPLVRPRMPLHLALKPLEEPSAEKVTLASKPPTESEQDDVFRVKLARERLQARLVETLRDESFEIVTVLDAPGPQSAEWSAEELDAWWVEQTKRCGADVFLECRAVYDDHVALGWTSGGAYTDNLLYFFLGGPICYTVNDRSYRAPAVLEGTYYDLAQVHGQGASLDDPRVGILDTASIFEWIDYDFIDRNGGEMVPFVKSLVVPTGFMQLDTERARDKMQADVVEKLAVDFSHRTYDQRETIMRAGRRTGFTLDTRWNVPELVATPSGWSLRVDLRLWPGPGMQKLREIVLVADGKPLRTVPLADAVEEKTGRGRTLGYAVGAEGTEALPAGLAHVQLEVADASAERNVRTFTLPVRWKQGGTP